MTATTYTDNRNHLDIIRMLEARVEVLQKRVKQLEHVQLSSCEICGNTMWSIESAVQPVGQARNGLT